MYGVGLNSPAIGGCKSSAWAGTPGNRQAVKRAHRVHNAHHAVLCLRGCAAILLELLGGKSESTALVD